jgi:hypothetical protein
MATSKRETTKRAREARAKAREAQTTLFASEPQATRKRVPAAVKRESKLAAQLARAAELREEAARAVMRRVTEMARAEGTTLTRAGNGKALALAHAIAEDAPKTATGRFTERQTGTFATAILRDVTSALRETEENAAKYEARLAQNIVDRAKEIFSYKEFTAAQKKDFHARALASVRGQKSQSGHDVDRAVERILIAVVKAAHPRKPRPTASSSAPKAPAKGPTASSSAPKAPAKGPTASSSAPRPLASVRAAAEPNDETTRLFDLAMMHVSAIRRAYALRPQSVSVDAIGLALAFKAFHLAMRDGAQPPLQWRKRRTTSIRGAA